MDRGKAKNNKEKFLWKNNPPKKASVDLRCAYCSEYQGLRCLGLLEYTYNDCTSYGSKGKKF